MDKKRKNWMSAIRRATAHQVSPGRVSLGTKLNNEGPCSIFSDTHGNHFHCTEKFVSQTHGEEYEHSKRVLII